MLVLPLLWHGVAILTSIILTLQYNQYTVGFRGFGYDYNATLGSGTEWFQRTLDWAFSPSVISGGEVLHVNTNRFQDMPYVPIPVIDPHLVLPLGDGIMRFKNDEDEEPPSIEYDWFDFDVEGIVRAPVALPMPEPVEHVPVPLVYFIRQASIRLISYDPAPTPLIGYVSLCTVFFAVGTIICTALLIKARREDEERLRNGWVPDFPPPYREPEPWWRGLIEFFIGETFPPIAPWDLPLR
ncbi:hypothetical protein DAEQUDRAFT_764189 [Daedalea quercina L-15889]|uniref:Uncharacterized protein n=1 Tax=Daedalea quercina L-15889 TaxID=1314783 RepID=A0A165RMC6_9APHY|nr:hypothetical protein DAEQUDRAFT_764189 [Daedalea quercina L-15889]